MGRPHQRDQVHQARIVALAKGGDGVAHLEAGGEPRTVFVAGTAPGDVVDIRLEQGNRGRLLRVIEPSSQRTAPPCPYADACGGCDWMHVRVDAQRLARKQIVEQALTRAGFEVGDIHSHDAPHELGYRARARLAVQVGKRSVLVGMRAARSHHIIPIESCMVLLPALDHVLGELATWLEGSKGRGEASLAMGKQSRPVVSLTWQGELCASVFAGAEERVQDGRWAGASILLEGAASPAVVGDPRSVAIAADGLPMVAPPGGFTQAFESMNHRLVQHVADVAQVAQAHGPVLELFAGSGNLSVALAHHTDELETVEQQATAVDAARENIALRSLRARLRVGDADEANIKDGIRLAVLDPPRSGAHGAAVRLASSKVRRVVMVSCDPATLARDLAILHHDGRLELQQVDVFEMFPHTSHVETVAVLNKVKR